MREPGPGTPKRCARQLAALGLLLAEPATGLDCRSGEGAVVVEETNGSFVCRPSVTLHSQGGAVTAAVLAELDPVLEADPLEPDPRGSR